MINRILERKMVTMMIRNKKHLKRYRVAAATRAAALLAIMFYVVNVQSVVKEVPKQMARQDELETTKPLIQDDGIAVF